MKTIAISFAIVAASATMAHAQTTGTTTSKCERDFMGVMVCTSTSTAGVEEPKQLPRPPLTAEERAEIDARDARWEEYCKPQIVQGRDGIDRYQYSRPGCEFGKSKP
jgi:hypothetical protein